LSEDPIRNDKNLYVYCDNNPIALIDPSGQSWREFWSDAQDWSAAFISASIERMKNIKDPISFLDWFTYGWISANGKRGQDALENLNGYTIGNWASSGAFDMISGAVNPEKPFSFEHWMDSIGVAMLIYGGYRGVKDIKLSARAVYGNEYTARVGRWMSQEEYNQMIKTGRVQIPLNGSQRSYVADPANMGAFPAAKSGSLYVEFDVPISSLYPAGNQNWSQIPGPGSLHDRLGIRNNSLPITQMPYAKNITLTGRK
jgi:hypothetical protein